MHSKAIVWIGILIAPSSLACEAVLPEFRDFLADDIQAVVRRIAQEENRLEESRPRIRSFAGTGQRQSAAPKPYRALGSGFTEEQVLAFNADPHGAACSPKHIHNDIGNRFCHDGAAMYISAMAEHAGIPKSLAPFVGTIGLIGKELGDKKISPADISIPNVDILKLVQSVAPTNISANCSIFQDGAIYCGTSYDF